jgi:hypothetical protein
MQTASSSARSQKRRVAAAWRRSKLRLSRTRPRTNYLEGWLQLSLNINHHFEEIQ